jgi:hypothetical protein
MSFFEKLVPISKVEHDRWRAKVLYKDQNPKWDEMLRVRDEIDKHWNDTNLSNQERLNIYNYLTEKFKEIPINLPSKMEVPKPPEPIIEPTNPPEAAQQQPGPPQPQQIDDQATLQMETPRSISEVIDPAELKMTKKHLAGYNQAVDLLDKHPDVISVGSISRELIVNGVPIPNSHAPTILKNFFSKSKIKGNLPGKAEFAAIYKKLKNVKPEPTIQKGKGKCFAKSKSPHPPGERIPPIKVLRLYH